jgi:hypothetical protein
MIEKKEREILDLNLKMQQLENKLEIQSESIPNIFHQ